MDIKSNSKIGLKTFINNLRSNNSQTKKIFSKYLKKLSMKNNNFRLISSDYNLPIIKPQNYLEKKYPRFNNMKRKSFNVILNKISLDKSELVNSKINDSNSKTISNDEIFFKIPTHQKKFLNIHIKPLYTNLKKGISICKERINNRRNSLTNNLKFNPNLENINKSSKYNMYIQLLPTTKGTDNSKINCNKIEQKISHESSFDLNDLNSVL